MTRVTGKELLKWAAFFPLALLFLLIVLPCLAAYSVFNLLRGFYLRTKFRRKWGPEGKSILFVYSESPNWQSYIEREILPKLSPHAISLNYSKRADWKVKKPLEAKIWAQWAGDRDFNPIAIVIPDRGKVRTIPFYRAFRDFKHGKDGLLRQREEELFDCVAQIRTAHN